MEVVGCEDWGRAREEDEDEEVHFEGRVDLVCRVVSD